MSPAERVEATAAAWLSRSDRGAWSSRDQRELDAWLAEATAHRVAYLRLRSAWQRGDRLAALRGAGALPGERTTPPIHARQWFRLAASIALAVSLLPLLHYSPPAREVRYATAVGEREIVPLDDGSRIDLNTDTTVRAAVDARARTVWMDNGEAFFEVAHDRYRPFVVHAGRERITVIGTKFSVRRTGDAVTVTVVEGKVRVDAVDRTRPTILTRDMIAITRDNRLIVTRNATEAIGNALGWRRGVVTFDRASLATIAAEFNRYNRRKLVLRDPNVAALQIGGSFDPRDIDDFTTLLRDGFRLEVHETGDEILVSR